MADCFFCRIAAGREKAHLVHEDQEVVAFLDRFPIRPGHVQIVPRAHHPYFDDLPPELAARIVGLGQTIAKSLKRLEGVERVGFLFSGGDIAHVHAHVVPLHEKTDLTSRRYIAERDLTFGPMRRARDADLFAMSRRLRDALG